LIAFYGKEVRGTEGGVYPHLYNKKILKNFQKKILKIAKKFYQKKSKNKNFGKILEFNIF